MDPVIPQIVEAFQFGFIQRAVVAGSFIGVCCAVLGVFLVLRRLSLIGEGLAHFSLAPIGFALMLGIYPLYVAVPMGILASFWILHLANRANMYGDAAIGLVSAIGVATGVIMASLGSGFNVDLFGYLFGDILAVSGVESAMTVALSFVVLLLVFLNYQELFAIAFDEEYARVIGLNTVRTNQILVILTTFTVILGIKVVGIMLVSSLIIFPAVTALQLSRGFKTAILFAVIAAICSVVMGIVLAFLFNLPAGATIVIVNFAFFLISYLLKTLTKA
ncbi:MAG: ABC transporter [Desulfobulbaceae bacterium S3730MH12]|nr:MAG: ABC transporter [Desulfobulbaceae bacterium S5133MH15]OEU57687.1 MAG: ABC transporter [Desulfobulbaceae bacterium S3730MH12]OEU84604.1 MAG: ABC transporter [Desulfobulbaceae bacterium C00003063]